MSGLDPSLWRAVSVFRWLTVVYVATVNLLDLDNVDHPLTSLLLTSAMVAWTIISTLAYSHAELRKWPLLALDLTIAAAMILATRLVEPAARIAQGEPTFPQMWVASALLAWAVCWQRRGGVAAAAVLSVADLVNRAAITAETVKGVVLLWLVGYVAGYVAGLARRAEAAFQEAVRIQASTQERERLSRRIHDGVLQVLALVQRRGAELGGEAAELGRLAGEQEHALRGLVATSPERVLPGGQMDLRDLLGTARDASHVHLSTPAEPVLMDEYQATELAAAVAEAVHNVRRHVAADADAWVLVEEEGDAVIVTVRDDGPGIAPGRLEQAAAQGRLGVAQSVLGRVRDLGGSATVTSIPGQGTEVELRVPR